MTTDEKLRLFTNAYRRWILDVADKCINGGDTGVCGNPLINNSPVAVVFLLLSYFEMIAKLEAGCTCDSQSKKHFIAGLRAVVPELAGLEAQDREALEVRLYRRGRCGLYHLGMLLENDIVVSGQPPGNVITLDGPRIRINPHRLVCRIKQHFQGLESTLSNSSSTTQRLKFERWFDHNFNI